MVIRALPVRSLKSESSSRAAGSPAKPVTLWGIDLFELRCRHRAQDGWPVRRNGEEERAVCPGRGSHPCTRPLLPQLRNHVRVGVSVMPRPGGRTRGVEVVERGRSGCLARWIQPGDLVDASGSCRAAEFEHARADARSDAADRPDWRAPRLQAADADEALRAAISIQSGEYLVAS